VLPKLVPLEAFLEFMGESVVFVLDLIVPSICLLNARSLFSRVIMSCR
jgi:fumarate reductase subunit C